VAIWLKFTPLLLRSILKPVSLFELSVQCNVISWHAVAVAIRFDGAEQEARKAVAIAEKSHTYARASGMLGRILSTTGRAREAEPLLREALALLEPRVPRQSNPMATILGNLGDCLAAQARYAEAEPLLNESYTILKAVHLPQSPMLDEARQRLVSLYEAWGKPQEAARYRSQLSNPAH